MIIYAIDGNYLVAHVDGIVIEIERKGHGTSFDNKLCWTIYHEGTIMFNGTCNTESEGMIKVEKELSSLANNLTLAFVDKIKYYNQNNG